MFKQMKLWDDKLGSTEKVINIALDRNGDGSPKEGSRIFGFRFKQWVNDKKRSTNVKITLGESGLSMFFSGQSKFMNRVWGTKPQTREESMDMGDDSFLQLWDKDKKVETPQTYTIKEDDKEITIVLEAHYDYDSDMQWITMKLGNSGKAIAIYPPKNSIRQANISQVFDYEVAPKVESILI